MKIDDIVQTKFSSPQHKVVVNLRFTSNYVGNVHNNFMNEFDLSMPQFNILRILRGAKQALNVHTIKDKMIEKSPNTTRLMDKLIDKKLIERVRCEHDRRVVYVNITKSGLKLLEDIDTKISQSMFLANALTDAEAETLSELLDKLRDGFA